MRQKENQYFPVITPAHSSVLVQKKNIRVVASRERETPICCMQITKAQISISTRPVHARAQIVGQGVRTTPGKSQNIGLFSNTGPDPLENHKATKLALILALVGPPFKWRFAGGPMMARF